jgi:hypothetical protein
MPKKTPAKIYKSAKDLEKAFQRFDKDYLKLLKKFGFDHFVYYYDMTGVSGFHLDEKKKIIEQLHSL